MAKKTSSHRSNNGGKLTSSAHGSSQHDIFLIDDETLKNGAFKDKVFCPVVNGEVKGHGLVKRDRAKHPPAMFDPPSGMTVIPESDWPARIEELNREQAFAKHARLRGDNGRPIPAKDQDGQGFCWFYSMTAAVQTVRAILGLPYVNLSAHAGACKIKGFRDEGGWCGLAAKFYREVGCPSVEFWPEKSMSRANDRPEAWANAALHKVVEEWVDLARQPYDQNMTRAQIFTNVLSGGCGPVDFDEWSHSVCAESARMVEAGSAALEIVNSWTPGWGDQGTGVIRTSWTVDGALAPRSVVVSRG